MSPTVAVSRRCWWSGGAQGQLGRRGAGAIRRARVRLVSAVGWIAVRGLVGENVPVGPDTHYALSGDIHIAYQVVGEGPFDLVFVPGFVTHVEFQSGVPSV